MPDQPSPFELPSIGQPRVKFTEFCKMISEVLQSRMRRGAGSIDIRDVSDEEILSLAYGSGYYKLRGLTRLVPRADVQLSPHVAYFGVELGNLQLLVALDPTSQHLKAYARARVSADVTTPWTAWRPWKNDAVDLPIDRPLLASELAQHV